MRRYAARLSLVLGVLLMMAGRAAGQVAWGQAGTPTGLPRGEPHFPSAAARAGGPLPVLVKLEAGLRTRPTTLAGQPLPLPGLARLGYLAYAAPAGEAAGLAAEWRGEPGVASAEPARVVTAADAIPNDPEWSRQYGPARLQAPRAWAITPGAAAVVIAIVDSGLDLDHPDLAPKVWHNPGEVPGNGLDDDLNGYVDDWSGWDFFNGDSDPDDDFGHGSHVAGIAAAAANNTVGIAGMAWGAQLMPLKVLASDGTGYDFHVAEAIMYAADNGARIINVSLGGYGLGAYVQEAVNYAHSRGVTVVAAAGNQGQAALLEPAAYSNALAVVATDENNNRASFSNYGAQADFAAPGSAIYSTLHNGGYGYMSGTSMAAPHVAGAAALLAGQPAYSTPLRIYEALQATALDLGAPGPDAYYGHGLIQAGNALALLPACLESIPGDCYRLFLPAAVFGP